MRLQLPEGVEGLGGIEERLLPEGVGGREEKEGSYPRVLALANSRWKSFSSFPFS